VLINVIVIHTVDSGYFSWGWTWK